jgi:hypothetical protein
MRCASITSNDETLVTDDDLAGDLIELIDEQSALVSAGDF